MSKSNVGVSIQNVTKLFHKKKAVDGISLDIKKGELMGLLGPSGAGKTTLVRIIAGLEIPDGGEIYIDDERVTDIAPKDRNVAMMFQSYALYPNKTVGDNLAFPLRAFKHAKSEIEKMVKETADILHITPLLDKYPAQLSGGERQRVAIGRAIVRKPKLYILDEPLTNLDAKLRVEMRGELKRLQKELGATTIFATPDDSEATTVADRIAVMKEGQIVQCDTPEALYNHPSTKFVAGFIGTPPINLLDCTLTDNGDPRLDVGEFHYHIPNMIDIVKKNASSTELLLGVRPEHIHVSKTKMYQDSVEGNVYVVEPTRPEMIADIKVGAKILKALVPSTSTYTLDEKVWLTFDKKRIHVIDRETGKVIV